MDVPPVRGITTHTIALCLVPPASGGSTTVSSSTLWTARARGAWLAVRSHHRYEPVHTIALGTLCPCLAHTPTREHSASLRRAD
ncbi:hypothetical protein EON67_00020 [archaeon]|nr:MAG: hypothetical protein EON67_00020 [archaeon]